MQQNVSGSHGSVKYARPAEDTSKQPPKLDVRYFYASPLQIDDPLAPVPPQTSSQTAATYPLRPFSDRDNEALDKAWKELQNDLEKLKAKRLSVESAGKDRRQGLRSPLHGGQLSEVAPSRSSSTRPQSRQGGRGPQKHSMGHRRELSQDESSQTSFPIAKSLEDRDRFRVGSPHSHNMERTPSSQSEFDTDSQGLTGMPFIRAPSRKKVSSLRPKTPTPSESRDASDGEIDEAKEKLVEPVAAVPVGVSRLHQISLPKLRMEPIYWRPVHDEFDVVRATWLYKDSMLPVEVEVANLLEKGYVELRPWTETWKDELNSAVEVGAEGEQKIAHLLWPEGTVTKPTTTVASEFNTGVDSTEEDTPEKRNEKMLRDACSTIDKSTHGTNVDNKAAESAEFAKDRQKRRFLNSTVIYINSKEAVILRPNLSPSAYHNRRPYASSIRKGVKIGVPVVRGFDQRSYDHLNPGQSTNAIANALQTDQFRQSEWQSLPNMGIGQRLSSSDTAHVTDLILVIHGIGQKLSERVESFNFTHSMNSFRREVHVERLQPTVVSHLRGDTGGIMVLPVNWRSTLSFDQGEYSEGAEENFDNFTLQDITPKSLPSVRNIISDVMLDIPYYLSHHQPKMIAAVVKEANRVYRLWCSNNPRFEKFGRVHLIAHSLGSVMALDILSKQPTRVDAFQMTEQSSLSEESQFVFDTRNLFICGSPAGFFLLLKKARLIPRKGQDKPGADGDDLMPGVAGTTDTFGCLAVDNIYNIVNPYDPVAYQLNATIDPTYAASLKPAVVPTASSSWFTFGRAFKNAYSSTGSSKTQRPVVGTRLPSNVELEIHNFTREEIAEKRAYLLNDNGQIDFFLKYGGGPLEIQYLTMLGAHSSYWLSKDFVRMLVLEVGRKPGKEGALAALRAVKKKAYTT